MIQRFTDVIVPAMCGRRESASDDISVPSRATSSREEGRGHPPSPIVSVILTHLEGYWPFKIATSHVARKFLL